MSRFPLVFYSNRPFTIVIEENAGNAIVNMILIGPRGLHGRLRILILLDRPPYRVLFNNITCC